MRLHVLPTAADACRAAAASIAATARSSVDARGLFTLALSGGATPLLMLHALADVDAPWAVTHVFQTDERCAPAGDPDRNLVLLETELLARLTGPRPVLHAMPVDGVSPEAAALAYALTLEGVAGRPPILDLVHLGLGEDGHTASLVPGDAALEIDDAAVAVTGSYRNRRRLTLTLPTLAAARARLWLVTGEAKAEMLRRLVDGDASMPAGRVARTAAFVFADRPAAARLDRAATFE